MHLEEGRRFAPGFSIFGAILLSLLAGCAGKAGALFAYRPTTEEVAGAVQGVNDAIMAVSGKVDQSASTNDTWAVRTLAATPVIYVICYVGTKIIWSWLGRKRGAARVVKRKTAENADERR